ncbi:MAG: ABC transporter permease [Planctomycetota bacterium]
MILQVISIHLRRLRHNRVEWVLTFVVPIAFFSIFALIFSRGVGSTPRIKVVLVNDCEPVAASTLPQGDDLEGNAGDPSFSQVMQTPFDPLPEKAEKIMRLLRDDEGLRVMRDENVSMARDEAESMVRRGTATIAIVLSRGDDQVKAELLNDASDQVASQVVAALLTRAFIQSEMPAAETSNSRPDASMAQQPRAMGKPAIGGNNAASQADAEPAAFNQFVGRMAGGPAAAMSSLQPPSIAVVNVMGQGKSNPVISVYAAGIAVMFLLFGATSGGGVLLEERENQTLDRLLSSQMTMDHLLLGKWFYLTLLGCVQVTVMFIWAQLVFGLDLVASLDGFVIMTIVTSAAAASFGLFLATLCHTRGQLNGLSVVMVLSMSALGGSMVPRYIMSEKLREAGLWTFNAWALDGYDKVFWRGLPPSELGPQLAVLLATAFGLLVLARILALRWEFS